MGRISIWAWLSLLCVYLPTTLCAPAIQFENCDRGYEKMGCVQEGNTEMDLIVYDRYAIDWGKFPESIHSLACRCERKAREDGYTYFSIRFYAECWAGKNKADIEEVLTDNNKLADNCIGGDFKKCNDTIEEECVGTKKSEYVFSVKPPVDGGLSAWTNFSKCSKPCDGGYQVRTRSCTNPPPKYGGKDCVGAVEETRECNIQPCPVDGGLSEWSNFTECSRPCGGGNQTRSRSCTNPSPAHGGKNCQGVLKELRVCNSQSCPVDGGLSEWSNFTECSRPCGGGNQTRSRSCTNPSPAHGGKNCQGVLKEQRACNSQSCPVDGGLSSWSNFTACSSTCGGGKQQRSRTCTNPPPSHNGKDCVGPLREEKVCNSNPCPVDGGLSNWGSFSRCTKKCGGGFQQRSRSCSSPRPAHGGKGCVGTLIDKRVCNTQACQCFNYRYLGHRKRCRSNVYTHRPGRCDGWQRVGLEECKRKCSRNEAPGGCPRPSKPCKYVVWDRNPGALPGWCQLATDGCSIGGANGGHQLWVRQC